MGMEEVMSRISRPIPADGCLHVMCRGNNRQFIFNSEDDFRYYYELLRDLREENHIDIYHYCLMSNHLHMIVSLYEDSTLSKYMKQVNLGFFHYFKKQYDYSGHLWQGRYKSCIIEKNNYLLQCGKYIEMNPVRAGIVESPDQYKYSSFKYYSMGNSDKLVTENPLFHEFGSSLKRRRELYIDFVLPEFIKTRLGMERFVGTDEFIRKHEVRFQLKNTRLKRGRPRKDDK
jgi:putative transposase